MCVTHLLHTLAAIYVHYVATSNAAIQQISNAAIQQISKATNATDVDECNEEHATYLFILKQPSRYGYT
jgi:hypothetical protein